MTGISEHAIDTDEDFVQREWLVRCLDEDANASVCSVEASAGEVEVATLSGRLITLNEAQFPAFRRALDAAIAQANRDLVSFRTNKN